jgi:F420-dependent oxidoreductase-like protein
MTIKHGIFLPMGFGQEFAHLDDPVEAFENLIQTAQIADEYGYETVWALDHLQTVPPSQEFVFEVWSTVTALARATKRVRVGQMVTSVGYRNPALQAKMASTVDVLSRGRFTFGIGAGWYQPDYVGFGYEFPDAPERLRQVREAVQIILSMWTEKETTFEGEHFQVRGVINQPQGVQKPHIPVLIGGAGEKVTLKLVAEYGDACNVIESPEGLKHKFSVLKKHCETVGRDYNSVRRTATTLCIIADTDKEALAAVPDGVGAIYPGDPGSYCLVGTVETIRERIAAY